LQFKIIFFKSTYNLRMKYQCSTPLEITHKCSKRRRYMQLNQYLLVSGLEFINIHIQYSTWNQLIFIAMSAKMTWGPLVPLLCYCNMWYFQCHWALFFTSLTILCLNRFPFVNDKVLLTTLLSIKLFIKKQGWPKGQTTQATVLGFKIG